MPKITIIGDVHGKTTEYKKMLEQRFKDQRTIQVGDMGFGFSRNPEGMSPMPMNHRWFRGNHDKPELCRAHPNYLGDWGYLEEEKMFFLAGAFSIDRVWRVPGVTWWPDEELSSEELQKAYELYVEKKPRVVISHEAPSKAAKLMLYDLSGEYFAAKGECSMSRTAEALQRMLDAWAPIEWVFGHYHVDKTFTWGCTKFTCVNELSTYELNTEAS
jgi:hypothetical protein